MRRLSATSLFLLPAFAHASVPRASSPEVTTSSSSPSYRTEPSTPSPLPEYRPEIPDALRQFILELTPSSKVEHRQAGGFGGGPGAHAAGPTQLSPVTVYDIGAGPVTYTQAFSSTPEQWTTKGPGSIGLGAISGKVGVVKSKNAAAPMMAPETSTEGMGTASRSVGGLYLLSCWPLYYRDWRTDELAAKLLKHKEKEGNRLEQFKLSTFDDDMLTRLEHVQLHLGRKSNSGHISACRAPTTSSSVTGREVQVTFDLYTPEVAESEVGDMMVQRAFHRTSPPSVDVSVESQKVSGLHRSQAEQGKQNKVLETVTKNGPQPGKPKRMCSAPAATPSKPVVIPTRTQMPKQHRQRSNHIEGNGKGNSNTHDLYDIPPSMAALLAITTLPAPRGLNIRRGAGRYERRDSLSPDGARQPLSGSSPRSWTILQSPPEEADFVLETDVWSIASDGTAAAISSFRSLSPESMPSLDADIEPASPESSLIPETPALRLSRSPRYEKIKYSEFLSIDDPHPLSIDSLQDLDFSPNISQPPTTLAAADLTRSKKVRSSSPLKSNLTTSLERLKSAARSVSWPTPSFTSGIINPNANVTEGRPRMRHRRTSSNKSPIKNGIRHYLDLEDTPAHIYFEETSFEQDMSICASIQLQPYTHRVLPHLPSDSAARPSSDRATAPPIFLPAADPLTLPGIDSPRPREPRENSDFLRVVVLEMNMRRAGKLGDEIGRARLWLGPRAGEVRKGGEEDDVSRKRDGAVPSRWRPVAC